MSKPKNKPKKVKETNEGLEENDVSTLKKNEEVLEETKFEMPNLLILKHIENKFKQTYSENIKKQEEDFIKNLGENIKYVKMLEGTPYNFTSTNGFSYTNLEQEQIEKISNALIVPLKQQNLISEETTNSNIELMGIISPTGEKLPNISVPIRQFESGNWIVSPEWGLNVIYELPPKKGVQINCIKELSKYMEQESIYQYTGWTEIDGKRVFLHAGGAIGTDKLIKVDLGDEVLNRYCFTEKEFKIKDTLQITFKFLEVAPIRITLPILALVYMSIFTSIFEELGISIGFLTWVVGPQQSKKTSTVSAICSSFGNFDRSHAPMNFFDGIPSIKEKSNKCKDVLVLCDDYFPSSNKQDVAEMKRANEAIIRLCFDRTSGSRSKSNGEMRKTPRAKGQIIATGEKFPDVSESRMTRILFINIKKGDINEKELEYIQEHQEELQYSMRKFIEHIIKNFEIIKVEIAKIFKNKVKEASKEIESRSAEMLAGLYIGYSILIDFACSNKVMTVEEKENMLKEGWKTLTDLGKEQNSIVEVTSPIKMFVSAVEVLTNTEKLTTVDYTSAKYMKQQDIMKDGFIGFFNIEKDKTKVYLIYPDLLYKAVKNFYSQQGISFPWNKAEMCKELFNQGYLYKTAKQERPQIRRDNPRSGQEETFIGLLQNKIHIACRYNENGNILTK